MILLITYFNLMKEILMSEFTKAAIIRLKTSIKGRTKTVQNKEYREGFITGSRLVWDYILIIHHSYNPKLTWTQ